MRAHAWVTITLFCAAAIGCGGMEDDLDVVTSDIEGKKPFAFQTDKGHYVVAENGGGSKLNANRVAIGPWETFTLYELGGDLVALRAASGHWVTAEGGGGGRVVANRTHRAEWETFRLIRSWDGRVAFQTHNGHFLVAENGGGSVLWADRRAIGPWELFRALRQ